MKFAAAAATANRLMERFGSVIVFTRVEQAFNPVTQITSSTVIEQWSMNGVARVPGRTAEMRVGSLEKRNLLQVDLAPLGGTLPQPGDKATWESQDWTVVWVGALNPAGDGSPFATVYLER